METRYRALRLISLLYRVIGILIIILAILGGVLTAIGGAGLGVSVPGVEPTTGAGTASILAGIGVAIGGILSGLGVLAIGELIKLLIDTEENTRATQALLRQVGRLLQNQNR